MRECKFNSGVFRSGEIEQFVQSDEPVRSRGGTGVIAVGNPCQFDCFGARTVPLEIVGFTAYPQMKNRLPPGRAGHMQSHPAPVSAPLKIGPGIRLQGDYGGMQRRRNRIRELDGEDFIPGRVAALIRSGRGVPLAGLGVPAEVLYWQGLHLGNPVAALDS